MELEDRRDSLRLMALIARGCGFDHEDLKEYTPPSVQLAEHLEKAGEPEADTAEGRQLEVLRFIAETGGD